MHTSTPAAVHVSATVSSQVRISWGNNSMMLPISPELWSQILYGPCCSTVLRKRSLRAAGSCCCRCRCGTTAACPAAAPVLGLGTLHLLWCLCCLQKAWPQPGLLLVPLLLPACAPMLLLSLLPAANSPCAEDSSPAALGRSSWGPSDPKTAPAFQLLGLA